VSFDDLAGKLAPLGNEDGIVGQRRRDRDGFDLHADLCRCGGQWLQQANRNPTRGRNAGDGMQFSLRPHGLGSFGRGDLKAGACFDPQAALHCTGGAYAERVAIPQKLQVGRIGRIACRRVNAVLVAQSHQGSQAQALCAAGGFEGGGRNAPRLLRNDYLSFYFGWSLDCGHGWPLVGSGLLFNCQFDN
jgi:hypothetical protein